MAAYQTKKSLRRTSGAPKCYTQLEEDAEHALNDDKKDRQMKQIVRQSIFQHKNWAMKEKMKLMIFFAYYGALPDWNSERRSIYLYKHMSNFMKKSRTPEQCKNIHSPLKRKFARLDEVVEAMRVQLELEENYEKLLSKYEKQIEIYQLQNKLKDEVLSDQRYESLRSRRVTEIQDKINKVVGELYMKENTRKCKTEKVQYEEIEKNSDVSPTKNIDKASLAVFEAERQKLLKQCDFYFREWLRLSLVLEKRQQAKRGQNQK